MVSTVTLFIDYASLCFIFAISLRFVNWNFIRIYSEALSGASNKLRLLGDWLIEYVIFLHNLAQQWRHKRNKIWLKGSLGDEDDARTSNTRIAQRKRAIPHTTIKKMTCVVVTALCSPELGLQTSVTTSHVTCVIIHCVWIIDNMEAPLTSCQTVLLSMLTDFHCMETVEDLNVWLVWLRS